METWLLVSSILLWIVVLVNLVLTLALVRRVNGSAEATLETGPTPGEKAPDFTATALTGETVTLSDYARHSVAFVFVAPDCQPCHETIPQLRELAPGAHEAGTDLVLVCSGTRTETEKLVHNLDIQLPVLIAPRAENAFFETYKIMMTPSFCLLDTQSIVQDSGHPGPENRSWKRLTQLWGRQPLLLESK